MGTIRKVGGPAPATVSRPPAPETAPAHGHPPGTAHAPASRAMARSGSEVVVVEGLAKTYGDGTRAIEDVSFQVRRGEIFGLLGPNGAGKTTTMRILGTLQPASGGTARVLGFDVQAQAHEVRRRIGFAMQEVGVDDLASSREMLTLHARLHGIPKAQAQQRAQASLEQFDLAEHADRRAARFSGGMKRRLDLAVSLIHGPEVLILDEPSTGLDPKTRADVWALLRRLRKEEGLTILMSTHYMEEADTLCDRLAFLAGGRIAATDTPANLKRGLGSDVVRVQVQRAPSSLQLQALDRAFGSGRVRWEDGEVAVEVEDGSASLLAVLRVLEQAGLQVGAARVVGPSLDDVFARYTGARLGGNGDAPHAPAAARSRAPAKEVRR